MTANMKLKEYLQQHSERGVTGDEIIVEPEQGTNILTLISVIDELIKRDAQHLGLDFQIAKLHQLGF